MKIGLTSIFVHNPVEAFRFYTEILGFIEHTFMPDARLAIVVSPEDKDGTTLLLEPNDTPFARIYQQEIYKAGLPAIVFSTDDIFREYENLKSKSVVFKKQPVKTEWGYEAMFYDGCGNYIQLHQQDN